MLPIVVAIWALVGLGFFRPNTLRSVWHRTQYPCLALARGEVEVAERSYQSSIAKARRFGADDVRCGLMMNELARYLDRAGRRYDAEKLLVESIPILEMKRNEEPVAYLLGLNHYATYLFRLRDFDRAQALLEKMLDWTPVAKKEAHRRIISLAEYLPVMEVAGRIHLATLFLEIEALPEAETTLNQAEQGLALLNRIQREECEHGFWGVQSLWFIKAGQIERAEAVCQKIRDQGSSFYLRARTKIHLARHEYAAAESLLLPAMAGAISGKATRPEHLELLLLYAEALFGQAVYKNAWTMVEFACVHIAYHGIPRDAFWHQTVESWLRRATKLGNLEATKLLERELQKIPVATAQGITILENLRAIAKRP